MSIETVHEELDEPNGAQNTRLEGGTTNPQHASEATERQQSRKEQLGPMDDDEESRDLKEAKCSSQRAGKSKT